MTWKDDLAIGVSGIDSQHKELCDAIDNLLDACKQGKGRNEIVSTMNFLFDYTQKHFKDEEELQRKSGYPKCAAHKQLHDGFVARLLEMRDDIVKNGITIATVGQVNTFVTSWLLNHIKRVDKELAEYINK
jgi:hemerythrin